MTFQKTVTISDLCYAYNRHEVLCGINGSLYQGEVLGIIGPNGGGKTTLLKLIAGLLPLQKGSIHYNDSLLISKKTSIGYVPQQWAVDRQFPISVAKLIESGLIQMEPWGIFYSQKAKKKTDALIEQFNLDKCRNRSIDEISGGQLQRALLARALVHEPSLLFLDEATSQIDIESRAIIYDELIKIKPQTTIIMVTHLLKESEKLIDKIWCIQKTKEEISKAQLCNHHSYGLYHEPSDKQHEDFNA